MPTIYDDRSLPLHPDNPVVVVLGMNPGREEDKANEPFVGRSGKILRGYKTGDEWKPGPYIDGIDLRSRASIFYSNSARCYSCLGNPTPKHHNACWPHLLADLNAIANSRQGNAPLCILLLGADACKSFYRNTTGKGLSLDAALLKTGDPIQVGAHVWHPFATFHPAYILRVPAKIHAVQDHLRLLRNFLDGSAPLQCKPQVVPACAPTPASPRIISIDIETYGLFTHTNDGRELPEQTVFNPQRSLETDGVLSDDMIQTVSITVPKVDPRCSSTNRSTPSTTPLSTEKPSKSASAPAAQSSSAACTTSETTSSSSSLSPPASLSCVTSSSHVPPPLVSPSKEKPSWNATLLSELEPAETMVLQMSDAHHRKILRKWLKHADSLVGMNLPFDVSYLRATHLGRHILTPSSHTLIDLSICNYLNNPDRMEKSLKGISLVLGNHRYDPEEIAAGGRRYATSRDPGAIRYNSEDTHATLLDVATLARHTQESYPSSDKLSDRCLRHYNSTLWTCIRMGESGIPVSRSMLRSLQTDLAGRSEQAAGVCGAAGLTLAGPGSMRSKDDFIFRVWEACSDNNPARVIKNAQRKLQFTKKTGKLSTGRDNRTLLEGLLPFGHELRPILDSYGRHSKCQKVLSSYIAPLLGDAEDVRSSVLDSGRSHPTWFPVPTHAKDAAGGAGGTEQGRITCKFPAAQTFPPPVKACIAPWSSDWCIVWVDWSQLELRVFALLSGEPVLLAEYRKEKPDLHSTTAGRIIPGFADLDPGSQEYDRDRQLGKMSNFARIFRGSAPVMQMQARALFGLDLPIEVFEEIERSFPTDWPVAYAWQDELILQTKRDHNIILPYTGQSRNFPGNKDLVDEIYISTIVNFPVQTIAGNLNLHFQANCYDLLPDINDKDPWAFQFCNIYDAIGFACKASRLTELDNLMDTAFNRIWEPGGYGHFLIEHYGHGLPFSYDKDVLTVEDSHKKLAKALERMNL